MLDGLLLLLHCQPAGFEFFCMLLLPLLLQFGNDHILPVAFDLQCPVLERGMEILFVDDFLILEIASPVLLDIFDQFPCFLLFLNIVCNLRVLDCVLLLPFLFMLLEKGRLPIFFLLS